MLALLLTALLPLVGCQQLQLQQELHQLRSSGGGPLPDGRPAHQPRVLPRVVGVREAAAATGRPAPAQFPRYVEETIDLSTPLEPLEGPAERHDEPQRRRPAQRGPRPAGRVTPDSRRPAERQHTPRPTELPEETDTRRPLRASFTTASGPADHSERPPTADGRRAGEERTGHPSEGRPQRVVEGRPHRVVEERPEHLSEERSEHLSEHRATEEDHRRPSNERPDRLIEDHHHRQSENQPGRQSEDHPGHRSSVDSSLQLYSDAWDLGAPPTDPPQEPADDSLSALEYELAAYNVTLFDAAMDYLLDDATNLTALLPEVTQWKADDVNMTRSIAVMNALFTALQARLGDQDSVLERYGLPATTGFNARPVRRTWADGAGRPYRRARPVVHRFRPQVDERFLGDRASCGSCQFTLMCWMSGGVARGGCGGFMFVCCDHGGRSAKSFNPPPPPNVDYGPVRNDPGCGLSDTSRIGITRRIVGGNQAGFGTFPWQAYILIGTSRCGGSLINRQHVITAGHCVARARPGQITITLGDYVLNSNREPLPAYKFKVRAIQVHPRFQFTPQADRYDVAVLTLDRPVPYAPHIQPICLPEKGEEFEGFYGWAAGWGALRPGSRVRPKELQVVDVPVINRHMCEQWHRQKGINVIIHEEMMCAGYINGGKDSCQGDSGGPLMIESDGRWYLMGIVSAGYSCAQGKQPGIYHRVSMTSDWISYVAGN
ncbi:uncharacterized protein LOC122388654 [Amphibalanus amphitrite]|uniref:uncharacterized protein LOC122388654 n=1 Tax=Amphibalanus amphitrite TaxID=1232801 RepID=UPI001C91C170|nr:uncharacterized protein LOC122388654 [Amphibalanus amphitrite]